MKRQPHIGFLGNRKHGFDEVGVVGPHIVGGIHSIEHLLVNFLMKVLDVVLANLIPSCRYDLLRGVSIAWVEIDFCRVNPEASQISNKRLELLNILVSPWL